MLPVRKVVFPVNGLGTRFLPATKAMPKEMLPVVDKPLIQYAVEEAAAAGITEMIFVTGRNKRAIEDHFDCHPELEQTRPDFLRSRNPSAAAPTRKRSRTLSPSDRSSQAMKSASTSPENAPLT